MLVLGCFNLGATPKTLFCYNRAHATTPKEAKAANKVAKRATAALVSIMVLLMFFLYT
jgi:uncharacterized protein YqhQ